MADSVPWTEETERQFQIAEAAASVVAQQYLGAGFHVLLDHCRNLPRWDAFLAAHLPDRPVCKVCLLPSLEANLARNAARTDKSFDPTILEGTILFTHARFAQDAGPPWLVLDSGTSSADELAEQVLAELRHREY